MSHSTRRRTVDSPHHTLTHTSTQAAPCTAWRPACWPDVTPYATHTAAHTTHRLPLPRYCARRHHLKHSPPSLTRTHTPPLPPRHRATPPPANTPLPIKTTHVQAHAGPRLPEVHTSTHPLLTSCHAPTRRHTHGAAASRHATPVNTSAPARGPVQVSPGETRVNTAQAAHPATARSQQTYTRTHHAHTHTPCKHKQPSSLS